MQKIMYISYILIIFRLNSTSKMLELLLILLLKIASHLNPRPYGDTILVTFEKPFNAGTCDEVRGARIGMYGGNLEIDLTGCSHSQPIFKSRKPRFKGPMIVNCPSCVVLEILKLSENSSRETTCTSCAERMRMARLEEESATLVVGEGTSLTPQAGSSTVTVPTETFLFNYIKAYVKENPHMEIVPVQKIYNKLKDSHNITFQDVKASLKRVQKEIQSEAEAAKAAAEVAKAAAEAKEKAAKAAAEAAAEAERKNMEDQVLSLLRECPQTKTKNEVFKWVKQTLPQVTQTIFNRVFNKVKTLKTCNQQEC